MQITVKAATLSVLTLTALCACRVAGDAGASRDVADSIRAGGSSTVSPSRDQHPDGSPHLGTTSGIVAPPRQTGNARIDSLAAQMRADEALSPAQVKARLPAHRRMVTRILSELSGDVRRMHVPATPAWTAMLDSLRRDLARLSVLPIEELRDAMPAHAARTAPDADACRFDERQGDVEPALTAARRR